jgi:hypothetical protein
MRLIKPAEWQSITINLITSIANSIQFSDIYNERYLHHHFTHQFQKEYGLSTLTKDTILHPEWPTYKSIHPPYGRYKLENDIYCINRSKGYSGFIDFAIGEYSKPYIGVEFTLKYGWPSEEVTYDFLKLLDKSNPFGFVVSLNIILRKNILSSSGRLKAFDKSIKYSFDEAKQRLNSNFKNSVEYYFIIAEIDNTHSRRFWIISHDSQNINKQQNILSIVQA